MSSPSVSRSPSRSAALFAPILLSVCLLSCAGSPSAQTTVPSSSTAPVLRAAKLRVSGGEPVLYDCGGGRRITARYYSLSDGSLAFVKLILPDGTLITLPNLGSASGARYSDDMHYVWWTKGEGAFLEERDESGEWKSVYPDCRQLPKKSG